MSYIFYHSKKIKEKESRDGNIDLGVGSVQMVMKATGKGVETEESRSMAWDKALRTSSEGCGSRRLVGSGWSGQKTEERCSRILGTLVSTLDGK